MQRGKSNTPSPASPGVSVLQSRSSLSTHPPKEPNPLKQLGPGPCVRFAKQCGPSLVGSRPCFQRLEVLPVEVFHFQFPIKRLQHSGTILQQAGAMQMFYFGEEISIIFGSRNFLLEKVQFSPSLTSYFPCVNLKEEVTVGNKVQSTLPSTMQNHHFLGWSASSLSF